VAAVNFVLDFRKENSLKNQLNTTTIAYNNK
jgi:hypothetical protein